MNTGLKICLVSYILFFSIACSRHLQEKLISESGRSTSSKSLDPPVYAKWILDKKNGMHQAIINSNICYELVYMPNEYIVCQETKSNTLNDSLLYSRLSELKGMQYFKLRISLVNEFGDLLKYNLNSPDQYTERIKYASFEMQNDIRLVQNKDTISCKLFHFERLFDAAPYSTFLLGFPLGQENTISDKVIEFNDNLFDQGTQTFTFHKDALTRIPKLRTL